MVIAAQTYVFSQMPDMGPAMPGLLQGLADGGYDAIEGLAGRPPETKEAMRRSGLKYIATHIGTSQLEPVQDLVGVCHAVGADGICSSGLLNWEQRTGDDYRATCRALNSLGAQFLYQGVRLYYHNHEFEFETVEAHSTGMDLLLRGLDFECVSLCLDVGWQAVAGVAPAPFLEQHAEKIGVVHLRDFRDGPSTPLGQGTLELDPVVAVVKHLPALRMLVVEQDPTTETPLDDMVASRAYLKDHFGL